MYYYNGYQDPKPREWNTEPVRGLRQLTSGLGGDGPVNADSAVIRLPSSKYRSGGNGVLKLGLGNGEYSWEFLTTNYSHQQNSGHAVCHERVAASSTCRTRANRSALDQGLGRNGNEGSSGS